jgi:hypothetical protein
LYSTLLFFVYKLSINNSFFSNLILNLHRNIVLRYIL